MKVRTYIALTVIALLFLVSGCTVTSIVTSATRANCGLHDGSLTIAQFNGKFLDPTYHQWIQYSVPASSAGYILQFPNSHYPQQISGQTISNLDGGEWIKILVTSPTGSVSAPFFDKSFFNGLPIELFNTSYNQSTNQIDYDGHNDGSGLGYGVFSNVFAPQSPGIIDIRQVIINNGSACSISSVGFADNLALLPSADCYDFRVDFFATCGQPGYSYFMVPMMKVGGVWTLLTWVGCQSTDRIQIIRTTSSGNFVYQVKQSGQPIYTSPPIDGSKTLFPVAIMKQSAQLSFSNLGFDACPNYSYLYAEPKKELDGTYFTTQGNLLGVKYKEKYNNTVLNYNIYDWDRTVRVSNASTSLHTWSYTLNTGYNYIDFDLTNMGFTNSHFYVLEITDAKGEIYKLRFQYKL